MRNRFRKNHGKKEDMVLQITSMADIFTIILVFLLKSFSTGISGITPNVILPEAKSQDEVTDTVKVEIAEHSILVDGKSVTTLDHFKFEKKDIESNGTPRSLNAALISEMSKEKQKSREPASVPSSGEPAPAKAPQAPHLMLLADQNTPYDTLKTVLAVASNSGYADFKLLVVEDK